MSNKIVLGQIRFCTSIIARSPNRQVRYVTIKYLDPRPKSDAIINIVRLAFTDPAARATTVYGMGVNAPRIVTINVPSSNLAAISCSSAGEIEEKKFVRRRSITSAAVAYATTPPKTEATVAVQNAKAALVRFANMYATINGSVIIGTTKADSTKEIIASKPIPYRVLKTPPASVATLVIRSSRADLFLVSNSSISYEILAPAESSVCGISRPNKSS